MTTPIHTKSDAEIYIEICERRQNVFDWIVQLEYGNLSGYSADQKQSRIKMYRREFDHLDALVNEYERRIATNDFPN